MLLDKHPFPFARAVFRHTVTAARSDFSAVGQCSFRRQSDGHDAQVSGRSRRRDRYGVRHIHNYADTWIVFGISGSLTYDGCESWSGVRA